MEMQKIGEAFGEAFGEELSLDEAEEAIEMSDILVAMADADGDGKVSFDEFKVLMKEGRYVVTYVLLSAIQIKLNIKMQSITVFLS